MVYLKKTTSRKKQSVLGMIRSKARWLGLVGTVWFCSACGANNGAANALPKEDYQYRGWIEALPVPLGELGLESAKSKSFGRHSQNAQAQQVYISRLEQLRRLPRPESAILRANLTYFITLNEDAIAASLFHFGAVEIGRFDPFATLQSGQFMSQLMVAERLGQLPPRYILDRHISDLAEFAEVDGVRLSQFLNAAPSLDAYWSSRDGRALYGYLADASTDGLPIPSVGRVDAKIDAVSILTTTDEDLGRVETMLLADDALQVGFRQKYGRFNHDIGDLTENQIGVRLPATHCVATGLAWAETTHDVTDIHLVWAFMRLKLIKARLDLGIHTQFWTLSDAQMFLANHGIEDGPLQQKLINDVVMAPARALAFAVCPDKISGLIRQTKGAGGQSFDAFYEDILAYMPNKMPDLVKAFKSRPATAQNP